MQHALMDALKALGEDPTRKPHCESPSSSFFSLLYGFAERFLFGATQVRQGSLGIRAEEGEEGIGLAVRGCFINFDPPQHPLEV